MQRTMAFLKRILRATCSTPNVSPVVSACTLVAIAMMATPIQLYIPMARLQHYGLAIFVVGLGYIIQVIWSWTRLGLWSRLGHLFSGVYFNAAAVTLYANPWLDPKITLRTENQEHWRDLIVIAFLFSTLVLVVFSILWVREERQTKHVPQRKDLS
ncbi:MAG: hypothetical protein HY711_00285 [Candidatus Melainabacteria bacterium]|nr:hypothetical protein [Candidatus Melainabacteria bacterium]